MHSNLRYPLFLLLLLLPALQLHARDINIPAGTLMECTLNEPRFSSATTSVGDPFLCYPRNLQEFGQPVFPRGTYFVGHLEDAQEPGHFVGKGYLKMTIDRIGLPSTDIPVRAKVISVSGYRVDKESKVIGHGHPTRDVVEWMLPPLWPWKVLTLPAKGPRPTLKGEVRLTLRVMDDFIVPQQETQRTSPTAPPMLRERDRSEQEKGWHHFGSPAGAIENPLVSAPNAVTIAYTDGPPASVSTITGTQSATLDQTQSGNAAANTWPAGVTVFALKDGSAIPAQQYWREGDSLIYVLISGDQGTATLDSVDWSATSRLNWQRGIRVSLHGPAVQEVKGQ